MGHRMFVAVMPPEEVRGQLERFLEPRPGLAWTSHSQWHLTLARLGGRDDATAWLRVLDTFTSSEWEVSEIALVDSFLGEGPRGRARHEVVARLPLGSRERRWWDPPGA